MSIFSPEQLYSPQGHRLTRALFAETAIKGDNPIMSLSPHDKEGFLNIRKLFIEMVADDPSEYDFAEHVFGDYAFWYNITQSKWMEPYLQEWRMVADVKRKSKSFKSLIREVENEGRSAFSAAKLLIEEPWKDKRNPKTKQAVQESTKRAVNEHKSDIARLSDYL